MNKPPGCGPFKVVKLCIPLLDTPWVHLKLFDLLAFLCHSRGSPLSSALLLTDREIAPSSVWWKQGPSTKHEAPPWIPAAWAGLSHRCRPSEQQSAAVHTWRAGSGLFTDNAVMSVQDGVTEWIHALRYLWGSFRAVVQECFGCETRKAKRNVWESQLQIVLVTPFGS